MNKNYVELQLRKIEAVLQTYDNILGYTRDLFGVDVSKAGLLNQTGKNAIKNIRDAIEKGEQHETDH